LASLFAGFVLLGGWIGVQWFLSATDIKIGYNWHWKGTSFHPQFDIRN